MSDDSNRPYIPPPSEFEAGSPEAELWTEIALAAVTGFTSAMWSNDRAKKLNIMSPAITACNAAEVADRVLLEFKSRVRPKAPVLKPSSPAPAFPKLE